mmetsp:Transcript_25862/g.50952  ORF Transcript_25862/g.50952 Transcript_25862/m.50952 type:complete len:176 (-) Transcript_25862:1009-1536(-)
MKIPHCGIASAPAEVCVEVCPALAAAAAAVAVVTSKEVCPGYIQLTGLEVSVPAHRPAGAAAGAGGGGGGRAAAVGAAAAGGGGGNAAAVGGGGDDAVDCTYRAADKRAGVDAVDDSYRAAGNCAGDAGERLQVACGRVWVAGRGGGQGQAPRVAFSPDCGMTQIVGTIRLHPRL